MFYLLIFYLGAILGSFLGLVAYRLPLGKPIIKDRSRCENCNKEIKNINLIPIFSYIRLKGKCLNCNQSISRRIFFIEIINAFLSLIHFIYFSINLNSLLAFLCIEILLVISIIDIDYKIIPNSLNILLGLIGILKALLEGSILNKAIYCLIFLFVSIILYKLSDGGFGLGDVKLYLGLVFFWPLNKLLLNILLSLITATIYSVYKLLRKKLTSKDTISFAPFIFISFLLTLYLGNEIIYIYFKTIG